MPGTTPVVLLAFANDNDPGKHLPELKAEMESLKSKLERHAHLEVEIIPYATMENIVEEFRLHRDKVIAFHYAGHAGKDKLSIMLPDGTTDDGNARAFAEFLGLQKNLQLVFLNGCATSGQIDHLLSVGIDHVIATVRGIEDTKARQFSENLYDSFLTNPSISRAFNEAKAIVQVLSRNLKISSVRDVERVGAKVDVNEFEWKMVSAKDSSDDLGYDIGEEKGVVPPEQAEEEQKSIENWKTKAIKAIAADEYDEVLSLIMDNCKNPRLQTTIILLSAQWNGLKKEVRSGLVSKENEAMRKARLGNSLMSVINDC